MLDGASPACVASSALSLVRLSLVRLGLARALLLVSARGRSCGLPLAGGLAGAAWLPGRRGQQRVGVQDVDLDVLGEDAERDVDRAGWPRGVQQRPEHGLADLPSALFGQRRLGQAVPDEVPDIRDRRWPGREDLR